MEPLSSVSCNNPIPCRTVSSIIWSCSTTLFACVWVAVHPNLPASDETWVTVTSRRVGLMLLALIAPELVAAWAVRQLLVARRLKAEFRNHEWTLVHGFFAIMGGFAENKDDELRTLSIQDLKSICKIERIDSIPNSERCQIQISKKEIEDKSKGDALSKGLVVIQTTWFTLQCVARAVQHLPVTELELVTLAFASLNFIIYVLWWHKPLNVGYPILIARNPARCGDKEGQIRTRMPPGWAAIVHNLRSCSWATLKEEVPAALSKIPQATYRSSITSVNIFHSIFGLVERDDRPLDTFTDATVESYKESECDYLKPDMAKRVPVFYAGFLEENEQEWVRYSAALVATIFGAIHCCGWSFQFPSHTEQMLWRISSVVITFLPMPTLVFSKLFSDGNSKHERINALLAFPGGFLYLSCRFTLLVIPLMSLRSLPPGAYDTVVWTTFIPHI